MTSACLVEIGHRVVCNDTDREKIAWLISGEVPVREPWLDVLVRRNLAERRLSFAACLADALAALPIDDSPLIIVVAVGTSQGEDGTADLGHVLGASLEIGWLVDRPVAVVDKSTVPVDKVGQESERSQSRCTL